MKKFKVNRTYGILISITFTGILLAVLFTTIFKKLFQISTWEDIKQMLEVFRSSAF